MYGFWFPTLFSKNSIFLKNHSIYFKKSSTNGKIAHTPACMYNFPLYVYLTALSTDFKKSLW